jgi:ADP-heptose:LPS heptosyltransferase
VKKLFMIDGGAGRAIAAIPALIKYAKKNEDFAVLLHGWDTLYWGIPELQDRTFNPEQKGIFDQVVSKAEEVISPEPYRVPGYFKQEKSLAEAFDYLINNTDDHSDLGTPVFKTSKMEEANAAGMIQDVKNQQQKQKTIVLQPFGRSAQKHPIGAIVDESSRSLDPNSYLKLVKKLSTKFNLVLMAEQQFFMEEDTYTMKPQADLRMWIPFIDAADYFIGVDSVGQHIARGLGKPGTVIVGSTFAINTTYPDYFNIVEKKDAKKYSPIRISGLESHLADRANDTLMDFNDEEINKIYANIIKDIEKKVK